MKNIPFLICRNSFKLLKGLWSDGVYCTNARIKHILLRLQAPKKLSNYQLMSLLFWHGHQTEKATKHISGVQDNQSRGIRHYRNLIRYLKECEKRSRLQEREARGIGWAKEIKQAFEYWSATPGNINLKPVKTKDFLSKEEESIFEQVNHLICSRRSIRFWQDHEISDQIIEKLIASGLSAASSCNRQGVMFVVVKHSFPRETTKEANNLAMLRNAPMIVYLCGDASLYPERFAPALDIGLAAGNIMICAEAIGLKGCAMYHSESFSQRKLQKQLGISNNMHVYLALLLGYPAEISKKPARMSSDLRSKIIDD